MATHPRNQPAIRSKDPEYPDIHEHERQDAAERETCHCTTPVKLRQYGGTWLCVCGKWMRRTV